MACKITQKKTFYALDAAILIPYISATFTI